MHYVFIMKKSVGIDYLPWLQKGDENVTQIIVFHYYFHPKMLHFHM